MAIILRSTAPTLLHHINGLKTAKEMWDRLTSKCRQDNLATRFSLVQRLFSTKLQEADSHGVDKHLDTMGSIRIQLANLGKPMDEELSALALLMSVPADSPQSPWYVWLHSYTASTTSTTWDSVTNALCAEAALQASKGIGTPSAAAYAASTSGGQKPFCTHCKKKTHVREKCWKLYPHLKPQRNEQQAADHHIGFINAAEQINGAAQWDNTAAALLSHASRPSKPIPTTFSGSGLWHIDSGASSHLTGDRSWFIELHSTPPLTITTAGVGRVTCTQTGTVALMTAHGRIDVRNVLYLPGSSVNLLSISSIIKSGLRVRFTEKACTVTTGHNKLGVRAVAHANLFSILASPLHSVTALSVTAGSSTPLDWKTAHARMGHLSATSVKAVFDKQMALGIATPTVGSPANIDHCTGCLYGKAHRRPFPTATTQRAGRPLQLVHSDLCGPVHDTLDKPSNRPVGPLHYLVTFIDDYSRYVWTSVISDKTSATVLNAFKQYKVWAEKQTGFEVQTLRTDGGGEYISNQFNTYLTILGIQRQVTTAYTPQQNGVAERMNRMLLEATRAMLHAAGLPLTDWKYALRTAVYLRNRSPTSALDGITPYHAWQGDKPDLSHLRTFGCRAYMHVNKKSTVCKLQKHALPVIFMGYHPAAKAWIVVDPLTKQEHTTRDATFHEDVPGVTLIHCSDEPVSYLCRVVLCTASSILALSHFVCCLHAVFSLLYGCVLTCGTTGWTILTTLPTMLSLSFSALFYRSLFVERAIETCFTYFSFRSPAP